MFSDTLRSLDFDEVADKKSLMGAILKNMIIGHKIIRESLDNCVSKVERTRPLRKAFTIIDSSRGRYQDVENKPLKDSDDVQEEAEINDAIEIDFNTIANPEAETYTQMKAIDDLLIYRSKMTKDDQKGAVYGKNFKFRLMQSF